MDVLERDGKPWTVADIDQLERERDDYKDRWETLGRVAKRMIEQRDEQLRGAVEALYSAHDFIARVLKWEGDDDTEQSELLAEIAKCLPSGGQSGTQSAHDPGESTA